MKSFIFAKRVMEISSPATVVISEKVRQLRRRGKEIIHLGIGDPDFSTPLEIKQGLEEAVNSDFTHYVDSRGIPELREAISEKLYSDNKIRVNPETEIIVTPGAKHAIFCSVLTFVNPGDEVIIIEPNYVSFEPITKIAGGSIRKLSLRMENDFQIDPDELKKKVTPKTKIIIINSPNNPTGKVFRREELECIARIAIDNDLVVISDEIYEKILYENSKHISIATLNGMDERTITVNGFSKTFSMTGWRLGYLAAPKNLVSQILKIHQHIATCTCSFIQKAGVVALKNQNCQHFTAKMIEEFTSRRKLAIHLLSQIEGLNFFVPQGAFYIFPDISVTGLGSLEFSKQLLNKHGVAVTPGIGFGSPYDKNVRIALTLPNNKIKQAIEKLVQFFSNYQKAHK